jgi:hypothetical protein
MIDSIQLDAQIREKQRSIRFDIRSYTINSIVDYFRAGDFYLPFYQRNFVWNVNSQSLFIESMIIGLPTSSLFLAETEDYRLEVVDGAQRMMTIEHYINGDLKLKGLEAIPELNDTTYDDLPHSQQRKFRNRTINAVMLSADTPYEARLEIFRRMNVGGVPRSSHEMRMAMLGEAERSLVNEMATHPIFNEAGNFSQFMHRRGDTEELVFRFFALSDSLEGYRGTMNQFLDKYTASITVDFDGQRLRSELERTSIFVEKYLKDSFRGKRVGRSKPLFDAIFVGTNLALREKPNLIPKNTSWVNSEKFFELVSVHAADLARRVKDRIYFVRDRLLQEG